MGKEKTFFTDEYYAKTGRDLKILKAQRNTPKTPVTGVSRQESLKERLLSARTKGWVALVDKPPEDPINLTKEPLPQTQSTRMLTPIVTEISYRTRDVRTPSQFITRQSDHQDTRQDEKTEYDCN